MRTPALTALTVVAALAFGPPAAEAKNQFQLSPRVGGPKTEFKATFVAPATVNGKATDYLLEAVGPPGCASLFEYAGAVQKGARVTMTLTPHDDIVLPDPSPRRWCRGSYIGFVYLSRPVQANLMVGYFGFGVGRQPVSLGG